MNRILKALGYIWATPTTLFFLLVWLLPMWLFKQFKPRRWEEGAWEWVVVADSWFGRGYGKAWAATTLGYTIMLTERYEDNPITGVHERRHVWQNWILGPFFTPVYMFGYLISFVHGFWLYRQGLNNDPWGWWFYRWNPFELDAYAHQNDTFPSTEIPMDGHFFASKNPES